MCLPLVLSMLPLSPFRLLLGFLGKRVGSGQIAEEAPCGCSDCVLRLVRGAFAPDRA